MAITIYHNTACGTSRKTLEAIRATGVEPTIIDYVKTPPTRAQLEDLIARSGLTARQAMRDKGDLYGELGLGDLSLPDSALLDAMLAHPILINRPFVVTDMGVRWCRARTAPLSSLSTIARFRPFWWAGSIASSI